MWIRGTYFLTQKNCLPIYIRYYIMQSQSSSPPRKWPTQPILIVSYHGIGCVGQENGLMMRKLAREQRLQQAAATEEEEQQQQGMMTSVTSGGGGGCVQEGTVYAEGSALRSSTLCQHCFCIRGKVSCSSPKCLIPLPGCKPLFHSYSCCPSHYDCGKLSRKTPC
jgi:hypothetical protein